MIEQRRTQGWVFTFLGADQDAYAEGEKLGVAPANRAGWDKSAAGVRKMYRDLEHSTSPHRAKPAARRHAEADVFYVEEEPEEQK